MKDFSSTCFAAFFAADHILKISSPEISITLNKTDFDLNQEQKLPKFQEKLLFQSVSKKISLRKKSRSWQSGRFRDRDSLLRITRAPKIKVYANPTYPNLTRVSGITFSMPLLGGKPPRPPRASRAMCYLEIWKFGEVRSYGFRH